MQRGHDAALAHGHHRAGEGILHRDRPADHLLPHPSQIHRRHAMHRARQPRAVGVRGIGLRPADVLDADRAVLGIPGVEPPTAVALQAQLL